MPRRNIRKFTSFQQHVLGTAISVIQSRGHCSRKLNTANGEITKTETVPSCNLDEKSVFGFHILSSESTESFPHRNQVSHLNLNTSEVHFKPLVKLKSSSVLNLCLLECKTMAAEKCSRARVKFLVIQNCFSAFRAVPNFLTKEFFCLRS